MTNQPLEEKETIFVDVQLKNGETVKVDIDKLGEFWATNADTIETTYSASRRPRRSKIVTSHK